MLFKIYQSFGFIKKSWARGRVFPPICSKLSVLRLGIASGAGRSTRPGSDRRGGALVALLLLRLSRLSVMSSPPTLLAGVTLADLGVALCPRRRLLLGVGVDFMLRGVGVPAVERRAAGEGV